VPCSRLGSGSNPVRICTMAAVKVMSVPIRRRLRW
jgi:hypothetical protein